MNLDLNILSRGNLYSYLEEMKFYKSTCIQKSESFIQEI